ncbi:hypothetical protein [Acidovorax sp. A1169]|uniref:hypothetical protein n=1 Tax=Acidovorax sp. A1169 TaxID=3059524 RepID=UPI00273801C3|nr:hypothetical protein [Acidovorax sp. A1169]MDP4076180.1 hypothetical protein [Acidovorax sp. A1169]
MKRIPLIALLVVLLAAGTTLLCVAALKPVSALAFAAFAAWLLAPYGLMAMALAALRRQQDAQPHGYLVAVLVSLGGIAWLAAILFWRPDAQGALAVLMVPVYQGVALVLLAPLAAWLGRRGTRG